jgi:hypothetical protein
MALLASAAGTVDASEIEAIEAALNRVLPNLPLLCLPHAVGLETYTRAIDACRQREVREGRSSIGSALGSLRDYLTDS